MTTYEWLAIIAVLIAGFYTLHKDLQNFVRREDCDRSRGDACSRITNVETRLGKLENRVTAAETKLNDKE